MEKIPWMLQQPHRHEYYVQFVTYFAFMFHVHARVVPRAIRLSVRYYF